MTINPCYLLPDTFFYILKPLLLNPGIANNLKGISRKIIIHQAEGRLAGPGGNPAAGVEES
jgi:hypothetical protein